MNVLKFYYKSLVINEDFLNELRLNDYFYPSFFVLIVSLFVVSSIPFALNLKIACVSANLTPAFNRFVQAKIFFSKYSIFVIFLSWLSGLISTLRVARKSMNIRRFIILLNLSSSPLAVMGFMTLLVILVSPGVLIPCEFEVNNLKRILELLFHYVTTAPGIASPVLLIIGVLWSSLRLHRMLRTVLLVREEIARRVVIYLVLSSLITPALLFLLTYLIL